MRKLILVLCLLFGVLKGEDVKIIACDNSLEMVDWGLEFIQHAEQSIDFAACFFGGEVLQTYLKSIEEQMRKHPKLKVNILMMPTFLEPRDKEFLFRLEREFTRQLHVTQTSSVIHVGKELFAIDNHVKMLVVDETYFTMGGTNLDDALCAEGTFPKERRKKEVLIGDKLPSGARDQDVVGRSALIAKEMRQKFHKLTTVWDEYNKYKRFASTNPDDFEGKTRYEEIDKGRRPFVEKFECADEPITIDSSQIKMILSGSMHNPNWITQEYCHLIENAKKEIVIGNLHFAPAEPMMDKLINASKRGVKTTVITNGIHDRAPSCNAYMSWPNRMNYLPLLYGKKFSFWEKSRCKNTPKCDAHFYEYYVKDILYHKKVMVVDRRYFVIGSYNLGLRSDQADYEYVFVIDSPQVAEEALKVLDKDIKFSLPVSEKKIQEWYFKPMISYQAEVQKQFNVFM
ncbi:MAG: Cardiolipin synthase [Chlamydiales bacterium]|nr:Cardiolipin synthase [Chlamydiales bacterium]MCH9619971.1 Cardiolipin synthase [Chlamydiales bacterium]MCH9622602.1 Cardiolipin synthase [Chlamydiales bacterium]